MKKILLSFIIVFALILSCTQSDQKKICFAFQDLETGFWVAAHAIITDSLEARNIKVLERNGQEDPIKQQEQVNSAIAQNVDGLLVIPQDGASALAMIEEANNAEIPIVIFNRPPDDDSKDALVVVADNEKIAENTVEYLAQEAMKLNRKVTPCILVGDLGDPNAIARKDGFYNVINKYPELFNEVIEVPTKWDATEAQANLETAYSSNSNIDLIFISSDFLFASVRAVLEPNGKWKKRGEEGHIIMGGLDGDKNACSLIREGYLDATGVQDVFNETKLALDALMEAIEKGEKTPSKWMKDEGFVLTQDNIEEKGMDMWGCYFLDKEGL